MTAADALGAFLMPAPVWYQKNYQGKHVIEAT